MGAVMQRENERGRVVDGRRTDGGGGRCCGLLVVHEVGGTGALYPHGQARVLTERVAANPVAALEAWGVERAASRQVDPLGPRVLGMAATGTPVAVMAGRLGVSTRQLHRRCLPVFGYGPRRLARPIPRELPVTTAVAPSRAFMSRPPVADNRHRRRASPSRPLPGLWSRA